MCGCGGKVAPGASFVHGHNLAFKHSSAAVQAAVQASMQQRRASKAQDAPPPLPAAVQEAASGPLSRPADITVAAPVPAPRENKAAIRFTQTDPKPSPAEVAASQVDMPVPKPRTRRAAVVPAVDAQLAGRADTIPPPAGPAIADIKTMPARGKGTRRASDLTADEMAAIVASKDSFRALGERYNITKDVVAAVRRKAAAERGVKDA
jgi:hypothetical protein